MSTWPKVKLGEVLRHRKEFVTIDDIQEYRRPRVQLQARGVVLRDVVAGASIKTKSQQVCRAGEFLVAEIDAKVGGFGIVPSELDGAIVSSHYFLFVIDEAKLQPEYLAYFIRTSAFRDQVAAQGSTNYAAIRASHVLAYEIPLPSLEEQYRVVEHIKKFASPLSEAVDLSRHSEELIGSMLESAIAARFSSLVSNKKARSLNDFLERSRKETSLSSSRQYSGLGTRMWGLGVYVHETRQGASFEAERYHVKPGQLIYNEVWAHNGALGIVPDLGDAMVVSRHFHVFDVNWSELLPDYLQRLFQSRWFWEQCQEGSVSSTGRGHMRRSHFLAIKIPVPPLDEQRRTVAELDALQAEVDALKGVQAETAAELDALLPAILDRAFKGELLPPDRVNVAPREPVRRVTRVIPKAQPYLLRFIPALLRAAGRPVSLDALNAAVALIFIPREDLMPVLVRLAGPPARAHFEDFEIAYQEGAFLSAIQILLRSGTLTSGDEPSSGPTLGLGGNLPPITPEIEADARHLAPLIGSVPPEVVAPILSRLQPARVKETVLMPT